MPSVSIAIATFNPVKEWLQRALDSCAGVDEIILCNDGSAHFDSAEYRFPAGVRANVLHNEKNVGSFKSYTIAVSRTTGEWISTPGDDDYFDAAAFPPLLARLKVTEADIVYYPCRTFGKSETIMGRHPTITYRMLRKRNRIYGGSFFRRRVWDFLEGYQLESSADWDFWLRAYKSGFVFEYFPLVCGHYRITDRSMFEQQAKALGRENLARLVRAHAARWKKIHRRRGNRITAALRKAGAFLFRPSRG
jgi:glycosyltransferase involved in cell wall biosynthesis